MPCDPKPKEGEPVEMNLPSFGIKVHRHEFKAIKSDYLYFVKGNRQRWWFRGMYEVCKLAGCLKAKFTGNPVPYFHDEIGQAGPDNVMTKEKR